MCARAGGYPPSRVASAGEPDDASRDARRRLAKLAWFDHLSRDARRRLAPELARLTRPGGRVGLSGVLKRQVRPGPCREARAERPGRALC